MKRLLAAVALCLVGCGGGTAPMGGGGGSGGGGSPPPSTPFAGTFVGALNEQTSCSDGTGGPSTLNVSWSITQTGSALSANLNIPCQGVPGSAIGTGASFPQFTCQTFTTNGTTWQDHITLLDLTITGNALSVNLQDTNVLVAGGSGSCNNVSSGTLTKQ